MRPLLLAIAGLLALAPFARADEAPRCTYVEVTRLPMRYVGEGLAPAVDGTIDGAAATMLVDTGAFDTQLTMNGANRRGLNLHMTGRYVEGFGGSSRLYTARLKDFTVGPARSARRIELYVIGTANITPVFDAIVGAPFLLQMDLEIDLRAKQMRFFRPHDCDKATLALWDEDTIAIPFERSSDRSPNPHFTVTVNGKELDAVIDTGAHHSTILRGAAKRAGIDVDGPGARRLGSVVGIGAERAPLWSTRVKTVTIGNETIDDAELGIVDAQGSTSAEMYLGQDFLRAHRVLFAMSQKKLYIAYLGGQPFTRSDKLEPWMRAEADAGNPDAQFTLANMYGGGRGVERDPVQARAWMAKAAANGQPHANLLLARREMLAGHPGEAIPRLRAALDQLPADRIGPLWLYIARVRNGEAALAQSELQATLKRQDDDGWPAPIAEFYLGKRDAAALLGSAAREPAFARRRTCDADTFMAEWHAARGEKRQADALLSARRALCGAPPAAPAAPAAAPADGGTPAS